MLDGILFEKQGVPTASIVTDEFLDTGHAMAKTWGLPNYEFLSMPHPTGNLTEEELDQRAEEIAPKVTQLLLKEKE